MERWQVVGISAAAVVIVIIAVIYFNNLQDTKVAEGANQLQTAIAKLRQQNYQEAIVELGQIVDNYSGDLAGRAQFNLGNAHYDSRNYNEAMSTFQIYIDKYHLSPLTTASAIAGIAACKESMSEFVLAGDKYMEAIQSYPESPSAPDYFLGAVRNYILGGDAEKAEQALKQMKEKFVSGEYYRTAARLFMSVKSA